MKLSRETGMELIFEIIIFCGGMFSISLFYMNVPLLTAMIIIAGVVVIKIWHGKDDVYFFVVGTVLGSVGEIICIYFGVWRYAIPTFLGIPLWLPFAWGFTVLMIKRISETIVKMGKA